MGKIKTCRVCSKDVRIAGLLYRCCNEACRAVFWDQTAIKKLQKTDASSKVVPRPAWLLKCLDEAQIDKPKSGSYFVYKLQLKVRLPKSLSKKRAQNLPNKQTGRFYVGMTGLHPYERFLNHIRGYKASWSANRMAYALVDYEGPMSRDDALEREECWAEELRSQGYDVHGGH